MRTAFVLDIETVPLDDTIPLDDEEQLKKASLDALTARVACIGVIRTVDFIPAESIAFCGLDESALLSEFWSYLSGNRAALLVTHNGIQFDLPFIWRRSVVQRIRPSIELDLRKFRTAPVFDTMQVWGNWEMRGARSLNDLARGLSLGSKIDEGSCVAKNWREGRLSAVQEYCLNDCWLTYACFCRMNFMDPQPLEAQELERVGRGQDSEIMAAAHH